MHDMIIQLYKHNSLQLNGDKTEFINLSKEYNADENLNFTIRDDKGNILKQKPTIKVLGYIINHKNDMENHISALYGKISSTYNDIKGAIPYLDKKNKKIIINSKLRGQLSLTLPLLINQNQCVQNKAEVLLMRRNKWIYGKSIFKKENRQICNTIGAPLPE